jgi:hypothetical protein
LIAMSLLERLGAAAVIVFEIAVYPLIRLAVRRVLGHAFRR